MSKLPSSSTVVHRLFAITHRRCRFGRPSSTNNVCDRRGPLHPHTSGGAGLSILARVATRPPRPRAGGGASSPGSLPRWAGGRSACWAWNGRRRGLGRCGWPRRSWPWWARSVLGPGSWPGQARADGAWAGRGADGGRGLRRGLGSCGRPRGLAGVGHGGHGHAA